MSTENHVNDVSRGKAEESTAPKETKGRAMRERSEMKFRQKKNAQFAAELRATIFSRLKITDPTDVEKIDVMAEVPPSAVPVTFVAIPKLLDEVWNRMISIGTRPFQQLATADNKKIFFRVCLKLFEAKLSYAQRTVEVKPNYPLDAMTAFTDQDLVLLNDIGNRLPFPIAIALEALGHFTVDKQQITPVAMKDAVPALSGAVNFVMSDISVLVRALSNPLPIDDAIAEVGQVLSSLPGVEWIADQERHTIRLAPESVEFWAGAQTLPIHQRNVFKSIIASLEMKPGFLLHSNLTHGAGTAVATVRYPEVYNAEEDEVLFYSNTIAPDYDYRLSVALQYGSEFRGMHHSRFCTNINSCLKKGSANYSVALHALVWAN